MLFIYQTGEIKREVTKIRTDVCWAFIPNMAKMEIHAAR